MKDHFKELPKLFLNELKNQYCKIIKNDKNVIFVLIKITDI